MPTTKYFFQNEVKNTVKNITIRTVQTGEILNKSK